MNDEDYWVDALKRYIWENSKDSYSWSRDTYGNLSNYEVYQLLKDYSMKDAAMVWNYNHSRHYNDTRGDEVATAVLEAYSMGVDFNVLLKKNSTVRAYWQQVQHDMIAKEKAREREEERIRKLQEKRAIEQAKREEVMTKLTPEELEAFGLVKKPRKVAKR